MDRDSRADRDSQGAPVERRVDRHSQGARPWRRPLGETLADQHWEADLD